METIQEKLGVFANGRENLETDDGFQLREGTSTYITDYDSKKGNIGIKDSCMWNIGS